MTDKKGIIFIPASTPELEKVFDDAFASLIPGKNCGTMEEFYKICGIEPPTKTTEEENGKEKKLNIWGIQ